MKEIKLFALLLLILSSCDAQQPEQDRTQYTVAFYNVENLFDTKDDPDTYDEEFTPKGAYRYTEKVYAEKLNNIATVISKLNGNNPPVLIGMAEVENATVLKGLTGNALLKSYGYKYIIFDGNDPRGIDNALLYRSEYFKVLNSRAVRIEKMSTRDILYVTGILNTDTVHILVNHWPSRREGVKQSDPKRAMVAKANKTIVDSLFRKNKDSKIVIMGDMNDNPTDESITTVLNAMHNSELKDHGYLYNPWVSIYKSGKGTSVYHRQWGHFDQIIISEAFLHDNNLRYKKAEIFDAAFIRNEGHGDDAYPKRSFRGRQWNHGYSDHLPVMIYLGR